MAKRIEKPRLVDVLRTLELNQEIAIVDVSELDKINQFTLDEMISRGYLEKIKLEDAVEKMTIRDNILVIYVDILKARMIERNMRRR